MIIFNAIIYIITHFAILAQTGDTVSAAQWAIVCVQREKQPSYLLAAPTQKTKKERTAVSYSTQIYRIARF